MCGYGIENGFPAYLRRRREDQLLSKNGAKPARNPVPRFRITPEGLLLSSSPRGCCRTVEDQRLFHGGGTTERLPPDVGQPLAGICAGPHLKGIRTGEYAQGHLVEVGELENHRCTARWVAEQRPIFGRVHHADRRTDRFFIGRIEWYDLQRARLREARPHRPRFDRRDLDT